MKMPCLFVGHGSPMIALENNEITRNFRMIGDKIKEEYKDIKGILCISAHWYTNKNVTNNSEEPKQIYDMYGFPEELYKVNYPVKGLPELAEKLSKIEGEDIKVTTDWGIDHGTWTVLSHMFPEADIPVVQLSVNGAVTEEQVYELGKKLAFLREEGYILIGSGNIVHNLREVSWDNPNGTVQTLEFDNYITSHIKKRNDYYIINHRMHSYSEYAVPTKDHFYPLIYILGASENEKPHVFNQTANLGAISMTSYIFGLDI